MTAPPLTRAPPVCSRRDLFVPKLIRSTRDGRLLPFEQYLGPEVRLLSYSGAHLAEAGMEPIANTADELRDAVLEMMDQLDGVGVEDAAIAQFAALARESGLIGFPRIGRAFVDKYRSLLPEEPALSLRRSA